MASNEEEQESESGRDVARLGPADLERLAEEVAEQLARREPTDVLLAASYTAPLPPPALFEDYERVVPGAGDRILKMAEAEGWSRRWMN